jgi:hypothetical protein
MKRRIYESWNGVAWYETNLFELPLTTHYIRIREIEDGKEKQFQVVEKSSSIPSEKKE